jgi:hypothetical protein
MKLDDIPIFVKLKVGLEENPFFASLGDSRSLPEKSSIRRGPEDIIFESCHNIGCPHIFHREFDLDLIISLGKGRLALS